MKVRDNRDAGRAGAFTLVEIMIVVAIIGLLATLAIPEFLRVRERSRASTCVNTLRLIEDAKYQYYMENPEVGIVVPGAADISVYIKGGAIPSEPTGSSYTINAVGEKPVCNSGLEGHGL